MLEGLEENSSGRVVIQTYNPDHYAIIHSKSQNYEAFYKTEIPLRKMLKYPPFCDIIVVRFQGSNVYELKKVSEIVYNKINSVAQDNLMIYKPVPAPIDKIKNKYRWRMILKCRVTSRILDIIKFGITDEKISKMKNTSIIVDINPNNLM